MPFLITALQAILLVQMSLGDTSLLPQQKLSVILNGANIIVTIAHKFSCEQGSKTNGIKDGHENLKPGGCSALRGGVDPPFL